jgi:KaiC/GvpD/RAD55 family RecA-like ATPase
MPINIRFERKDENGNIYYEDGDGKRIPDPTPEEIAEKEAIRQELIAESNRRFFEFQRKQSPFLLNVLDKPAPALPRLPLWGNYWHEREFCVMVGDTGVGKSLFAIKVGKMLAKPMHNSECKIQNVMPMQPNPSPSPNAKREGDEEKGGIPINDTPSPFQGTPPMLGGELKNTSPSQSEGTPFLKGDPKKVLYIDFELDAEEFWVRYGDEAGIENFYWAGFNANGQLPQTVESQTEWLLGSLEKHIVETGAEVLIIDQIDRVQIPIGKRVDFLFKLKALTRKYKLSTMLVVNTRARNFSKEVGLQHVYHSRLYVPMADSVIAIAADYNDELCRYIKPLKLRNRPLDYKAELECYSVIDDCERIVGEKRSLAGDFVSGTKLSLLFTAMRVEEDLLKPSKTKQKEQQIMRAEAMRRDGMTYEYIADNMQVPMITVKRWVSCIPVKPLPDGTNPLRRISPAWGEEDTSYDNMHAMASPEERGLKDEYDPDLIAREQEEMGLG